MISSIAIQPPREVAAAPALGLSSSPLRFWMLLVVALLAAAVFANSITNGFALDDVAIVEHNPHVLSLEWYKIWADNYWPSPEGPPDILYRPLTIWSYLANQALAPGAAWAFHLVNIGLHAVVSVLVTLLAYRIFRTAGVAFLSGLIFALHPIHTEVVANVVGRAELLAAMWSLLALLVFLPKGDITDLSSKPRHWAHGIIVAFCFLFAMLSKETPVALIGAIVFIDLWRWSNAGSMNRPTFLKFFRTQAARYYFPLLLAFGVYLALRLNGTSLLRDINGMHPIVNPLAQATLAERLLTPFMLLAKYMQLTVWPATLSADYSAPSIMPSANPFHPMILAGLLMTALGVVLTFATWKRRPQVALILVLFVFSYVLVANYLRIGTIFGERLFYWPSVFVIMLAAATLAWIWQVAREARFPRLVRSLTALAVIAACIAMSARTIVRNQDWQGNVALAISTARDNPQSAKACYWAGMTLVSQGTEPWMKDFGVQLLDRAIELYPTYGESYWELAKYYGRNQKIAESLKYLCLAARYRGGALEVRQALGHVKADVASRPIEEMLGQMDAWIAEKPEDPSRHLAHGIVLAAHGRHAEAEKSFGRTLDLEGTFHEAAAEIGLVRLHQGKAVEAVAMLRQYVMRVRFNVEARCQLARALMMLDPKQFPLALAEAEMNLEKAESLGNGDSRVRALRAELNRMKAGRETVLPAKVADIGPSPEAGR